MQRPGHISFTGTEPQPKYRKWDACARHGGQQSVAPITTDPDPLDRLSSVHHVSLSRYGPVSRKSRELFGPERPFVKVRPAYVTRNTPETFRDFRETGPRGVFLESPENFSGPKGHS